MNTNLNFQIINQKWFKAVSAPSNSLEVVYSSRNGRITVKDNITILFEAVVDYEPPIESLIDLFHLFNQ